MVNILKSILILTGLLIYSCSDSNSSEPINNGDGIDTLLNFSIGDYWIYETYELDQDSTRVEGSEVLDSVVIEKNTVKDGKGAFLLVRYRNGGIHDSIYIYSANSVYKYYDEANSEIPDFESGWLKIVDPDIETWLIKSFTNNNYPYEFKDTTIFTESDYVINGYRRDYDTTTLSNEKFIGREYNIKFDNLITFEFDFSGDSTFYSVREANLRTERYFTDENIGFYILQKDPSLHIITSDYPDFEPETTYVNGYRSELLRYNKK